MHEVKLRVKDKLFSDNLEYDEPFYFNVPLDNTGLPVLGTGDPKDHLYLSITSKKLLNNLNNDGIFHIDCTYKLIKNGFPVLIFGITDRVGQFDPIAYHITSHEEESDFVLFYEGLKNIASKLNIKCSPDFIMQDAWNALGCF